MDITRFDRAFGALPSDVTRLRPDLAIILGSGWSDALTIDRCLARIPYAAIPELGAATVAGHAGELIVYERAGKTVFAFAGRRHWYEGVGWETVVLPIELLRRLGCDTVLLTNASGGINPAFRPGDCVIIRDHINTVGINPLIGEHNPAWGARFPDMTEIYTPALRACLADVAKARGIRPLDGVYAFTSGPLYETPAEIHAYDHMGADLVGMSTVPEAVFAHACGLRVAGLSLVSNFAAGISQTPLAHAEVMATANAAKPTLATLVDGFIGKFE